MSKNKDLRHPGEDRTAGAVDGSPPVYPERIPPEELARAHRDACANAVWGVLRWLINSPINYRQMCRRAGHRPDYLYRRFRDPMRISIDDLSDFALALGAEPKFRTRPKTGWFAPEPPELSPHKDWRVRNASARLNLIQGNISALAVAALTDGALGRQDETPDDATGAEGDRRDEP